MFWGNMLNDNQILYYVIPYILDDLFLLLYYHSYESSVF